MSLDTHKYEAEAMPEARHSAIEEFARDERRPAVLLLAGLIIAALFFGLGILFDRWTSNRNAPHPPAVNANSSSNSNRANAPLPVTTPAAH